jgi:ComF family protein
MRSNATAPSHSEWGKPTPPETGLRERVYRGIWQAGQSTLDLLIPPRCLTCDRWVERQGQLCAVCFRATNFITDPVCIRCGLPFECGQSRICDDCLRDPPTFDCARAALRYDDQARRLVLPLKHADRVELAPVLARYMARSGAALLTSADVLVPVPLHRARLFRRRYNQAALLVQALSRLSGKPNLTDGMKRIRATPPLGELSARQRVAAVSGVFAVNRARLSKMAGAKVLLVDDVMTSGATTDACAQVLKSAGANSVDVLVAARVANPRSSRPGHA